MKFYWENKGTILKYTVQRVGLGLAAALIWHIAFNHQGLEGLLHNAFFVLGVVYLYLAWRNYTNSEGIGIRFISPGGYGNSLVTDRNIRDNPYEAQRRALEDSASDFKMIANLLAAVLYLIPCILSFLL